MTSDIKDPPAQPGHLRNGKAFLKKQTDPVSAAADRIKSKSRARKVRTFDPSKQMSAPLNWVAPAKTEEPA